MTLGVALFVCPLLGCGELPGTDNSRPFAEEPRYVGSAACAACHGEAHGAWHGSHHQRSMLPAAGGSVAGDFTDTAFVQDGVASHFSQRGNRFLVRTPDASGASTEFAVRYTFGVEPLQQLLLESPGGRLQAFTVAWDTEDRWWFHLQPEHGLGYGDPLHWTGLAHNWNFMCADCHSTAVRKGYDARTRTYQTEFAEVSVGCEACHGPASRHVAWAANPEMGIPAAARGAGRGGGPGPAVPTTGEASPAAAGLPGSPTGRWYQPVDEQPTVSGGLSELLVDRRHQPIDGRSPAAAGLSKSPVDRRYRPADERTPATSSFAEPPFILALRSQTEQINSCAPCHSRREQLADGFTPDQPFLDYYRPALLDPGLYEADGQILDEVYVYGSFLQSRMHARGVTCGHCHEPHSLGLRAQGNALCTGCHNEAGNPDFPTLRRSAYDRKEHHGHEPLSAGSECVSCHMPERTYMMVDRRSDHSFRIPRPDLTLSAAVPNTCNHCHDERSAEWARDVLERRFGAPQDAHFATVLADARRGVAGSATAEIGRMDSHPLPTTDARRGGPSIAAALATLGGDPTQAGIVRGTALSLMAAYDDGDTALALERGLRDPDALVRIGALRGAVRFDRASLWRYAEHLLDDPYRAVRGEAASLLAAALAALSGADRKRLLQALDEYLATQRFNADRPEAQTNMARVFMATGNPDSAEAALETALSLSPDWVPALVNLADLHRATGRDGSGGELLERALVAAPDAPEVKLARAFWLVRQNRDAEALPLLAAAVELAPWNPRYAYTYAVALHSQGESAKALEVIDLALRKRPDDRQLKRAGADIARVIGDTPRMRRYQDSR